MRRGYDPSRAYLARSRHTEGSCGHSANAGSRSCVGLPTVDLHTRTNLFRASDRIENVPNEPSPGQRCQTAVPAPAAHLDDRSAKPVSNAQGRVSQYVMVHAMSPQNAVSPRGVLTTECRHMRISEVDRPRVRARVSQTVSGVRSHRQPCAERCPCLCRALARICKPVCTRLRVTLNQSHRH